MPIGRRAFHRHKPSYNVQSRRQDPRVYWIQHRSLTVAVLIRKHPGV